MKSIVLAWRNVWRNTRRSILSIGIIGVGVAAILMVWGFMSGTFWGLRELTIATGVGHIQIGSPKSFDPAVYFDDPGLSKETAGEIQAFAEAQDHVRFGMQRINLEGLVTFGRTTVSFTGTGIEPAKEARLSGVFAPLTEGENLPIGEAEGKYKALVAAGLSRSLGCHPGDTVTVLVNMSDGGLNALDLQVSGIYQTGFPETDKRNILMSIGAAKELLGSDRINRIILSLDRTELTEEIRALIARRFPRVEVHGWEDLAAYYHQVVQLYRNMFTIFGIIILIVVFLSVINTMIMSIMERTREIGTLLAIGVPERFISTVFVFEGIIIGFLGSILGTLIALVGSSCIDALAIQMPPAPGRSLPYPLNIFMDLPTVLAASAAIIFIAGVAALAPSVKAARKSIVDSLNHT